MRIFLLILLFTSAAFGHNLIADNTLSDLVYRLSLNPESFGSEILSLQQKISQTKLQNTPEAKILLAKYKTQLKNYLEAVKILESPKI